MAHATDEEKREIAQSKATDEEKEFISSVKKNYTWVIVVITVAIIAFGAWYFYKH